jgi:putative transcriptional regulator
MKNNLRVERARVRMTQQDLADKTGVTRQTIVAIEQGKFNPSTVLALKMARVFGVTIETLFELEDTD